MQKLQETKFVGINAEGWRVVSEKEVLNQYLCNTCIYSNTQTENLKKHQNLSHVIECYTCNYFKDAVNKKNDLAGHLKNHHENHMDIEKLNIEALSNPYANVRTNKLVCKGKDESGAEIDAAEKRFRITCKGQYRCRH